MNFCADSEYINRIFNHYSEKSSYASHVLDKKTLQFYQSFHNKWFYFNKQTKTYIVHKENSKLKKQIKYNPPAKNHKTNARNHEKKQ